MASDGRHGPGGRLARSVSEDVIGENSPIKNKRNVDFLGKSIKILDQLSRSLNGCLDAN